MTVRFYRWGVTLRMPSRWIILRMPCVETWEHDHGPEWGERFANATDNGAEDPRECADGMCKYANIGGSEYCVLTKEKV